MSSPRPELKLDWCSHQAAKYAVEHWHYSKSLPVPPIVRVGVWEAEKFIGCVLFSRGASTNLLRPYGLKNTEGCELTRIALTSHQASVTRIVAIAIKMMMRENPGLRLILSYADPSQSHVGVIYQAGNWIYTGKSDSDRAYIDRAGVQHHARVVSEDGTGTRRQFGKTRRCLSAMGMTRIVTPGKHRYLMPLDPEIRAKIAPLAKPYPKRAGSIAGDAPATHAGQGGSTPTPALSISLGANTDWNTDKCAQPTES